MRASASKAAPPAMPATQSAPIIAHPDVKRMLLTMRALTQAARAICYATAMALDRAERGAGRSRAQAAHARASLLTPVAKAFSTDIGIEVASLGVQVHGGMGYIEETGAAQLYRDARIAAIYEGTNGIQAIDLVTRKLPLAGGAAVAAHLERIARHRRSGERQQRSGAWAGRRVRLDEAVESLARATDWLLAHLDKDADAALAGASPYLRLFGLATGGCLLAQQALAALRLRAARRRGAPRSGAFLCREFCGSGRRARTHHRRRRCGRHRRRRRAYIGVGHAFTASQCARRR